MQETATLQRVSGSAAWPLLVRWVPILKSDGSDVWGYDSVLWSNDTLLTGLAAFDEADNVKYAEYLTVPFRRIRMCVGSPEQNCIEHSFARKWSSARELFSQDEIRDLDVQQHAFLRAFGAKEGEYRECPMLEPGFNIDCGSGNRARWGYCANCAMQECQSSDADAAIGLGLSDQSGNSVGAGWTYMFASGVDSAACSGSNSNQAVWVWVEDLSQPSSAQFDVGFGGGLQLTLTGQNLAESADNAEITVCGSHCRVTAVEHMVNSTSVTCSIPAHVTEELLDAYPLTSPADEIARSEHVARFYTDQGELEAELAELAYTSPVDEPVAESDPFHIVNPTESSCSASVCSVMDSFVSRRVCHIKVQHRVARLCCGTLVSRAGLGSSWMLGRLSP
eukprot:894446-Amphidinium_carterae.1